MRKKKELSGNDAMNPLPNVINHNYEIMEVRKSSKQLLFYYLWRQKILLPQSYLLGHDSSKVYRVTES